MTCRVTSAVIRSILLVGLFYPAACPAAAPPAGARGKITGESHVNLRSGPDLTFPVVAVVRHGDTVIVEAEERGWYRVVLASGARGYIHKPLVDFIADIQPAQEPPPPPTIPAAKDSKIDSLPATSIKPSTVPKQWENWKWIVALLCCFFLGWILGGNYYLRRDHTRRHKLHL